MLGGVILMVIAVGMFAYNHYLSPRPGMPFIGILGTESLLGFPLDGAYLVAIIGIWTLVKAYRNR